MMAITDEMKLAEKRRRMCFMRALVDLSDFDRVRTDIDLGYDGPHEASVQRTIRCLMVGSHQNRGWDLG